LNISVALFQLAKGTFTKEPKSCDPLPAPAPEKRQQYLQKTSSNEGE